MELINVSKNNNGDNVVSAKDLHMFLEVKEKFTDWIKRMLDYGFQENVDFIRNVGKSTGGRKSEDYVLTIDTAKEISMLQRSEKGKEARQYFITIEKEHRKQSIAKPMSALDLIKLSIQAIEEQGQEIKEIKTEIEEIKAKQITSPIEYYSVAGFWSLNRIKIDSSLAKEISYKARKICNEMGYQIGKVPDAKYGTVNTYPNEVLKALLPQKNLSKN